MKFRACFGIDFGRLRQRREGAQVLPNAIYFDPHPETTGPLVDTNYAASAGGHSRVLVVLLMCREAQIRDAVVSYIAIDVVHEVMARVLTMEKKPCQTASRVGTPLKGDEEIPALPGMSGVGPHHPWLLAFNPREPAGIAIIGDEVCDMMGDGA